MGAFLDKPKTEKETSVECGNSLTVAVSAMQGWRLDMEDSHTIKLGVEGAPDTNFFAVFDGHGGSTVSTYAAVKIVDKICSTEEWKKDHTTPESIGQAMTRGFMEIDEDLRKIPSIARGDDRSGSTAIAAFVTPRHIIVANCGDSRSMLVRGNTAVEMSEDHKPYLEAETRRIEAAGGVVTMRRVNGDLAVSRALGDFVYKHLPELPAHQQQVSAEPEIRIEERQPANDQFLILACDGIWDVMSNQEVANFFVKETSDARAGGKELTQADFARIVQKLLDECLARNSRDNMSVVAVAFPAAGAIAPSTAQEIALVASAQSTTSM